MFLLKDEFWQIKEVPGKGLGVFAKRQIKAGTIIADYLGKIIKTAEYDLDLDKNGLYLMYYTDQTSIYPDLKKPGPHLLNHSCTPNCWIYTFKGHCLFFALRNIKPGQELTISYLLSPLDETCNPCTHVCRCGSKFCTGTMHLPKYKYQIWQKLQSVQRRETRTLKAVFGKTLPKLTSYPKIFPSDPIYATLAQMKYVTKLKSSDLS